MEFSQPYPVSGSTSSSFVTPSSKPETLSTSPFMQPGVIPPKVKSEMTELGKEIATRLKEIFYSYDNRKTSDNRSAQVTLGPSEIGTPCDRRLGMSLLGVPAVNPGGDGWAAFVGTCLHAGLDDMLTWADGGTGRFATEIPLKLPSTLVPKGTGDALDRVLCVFMDHKAQGQYSRRRLREQGPSDTYRVQVHTYGLGAVLAGEKVKHVAIVSWPRDGASLDELWVWTEKYDPKVAKAALARVDKLAAKVLPQKAAGLPLMQISRSLPTADKYECRFCPQYLKGDTEMEKGCPGV